MHHKKFARARTPRHRQSLSLPVHLPLSPSATLSRAELQRLVAEMVG